MGEQDLTRTEALYEQAFENLFTTAEAYFNEYVQVLRSYGIEPDPNMKLLRSKGMNSYYNLTDGQIYLALPSLRGGIGKLYLLMLRSMFDTESNDEILELFDLLLPRIVAHEMGHSLRHRYGQFQNDNLWLEEQVANQLAMALIKRKMPPERKQKIRAALAKSIEKLGRKIEAKDVALDSYRNIIQALNVSDQIGDSTLYNIELVRTVFSIDTDDLLRASGQLPEEVVNRIEQREEVIDYLNEHYTKDAARYTYSHFGWMYFDFLSKQSEYVDEFAVTRLNLKPKLLEEIDGSAVLDRIEIQALFRAYQTVPKRPDLGRRFFYKRYRNALLRRMEITTLKVPGGKVKSNLTQLLEMWEEGDSDALNLLELVCPPELKRLFPQFLGEDVETISLLPQKLLPTEMDKRLWNYFRAGGSDEEVSNTVKRLEVLERIPMLRPLPAEVQLWLAHRMYRLKLDSSEPVLWMGEKNADVFILVDGLLEILIQDETKSEPEHVGLIKPGSIFGEFSFITNEAATATVRAVRPSQCYVFKGADLRPMTYDHPTVLAQMTRSLADKLNQMNRLAAAQVTDKTMFQPFPTKKPLDQ